MVKFPPDPTRTIVGSVRQLFPAPVCTWSATLPPLARVSTWP